MNIEKMKEELLRLIDHAFVIAPSIEYYNRDKTWGRVTDEYFDHQAFITWRIEAKSVLQKLSNFNHELFSELLDSFTEYERKSDSGHSESIFVHRIMQLLVSATSLIESPLNDTEKQNTNTKSEQNTKNKGNILKYDEIDSWESINQDFDETKRSLGRKLNFISDSFKKQIIFRDIAQSYVLSKNGFDKPAVILAGSAIEEILRLYLHSKNISTKRNTFDEYIRVCVENGLLKKGISKLSESVRHFRNLVHLEKEITKKYTISKATAKNAVSSVFMIINDISGT
ncbi:MAG: hypothetical protein QQN41_10970 [Nitrosopumilus sp.]